MDNKRLGVMVDCSRNAVMTVDTVKKFIDALRKMGYNMLMLYTEDTYEVDNQPWFGYLRGRYSKVEMKEIIKEYLVAEAKVNAFHRAHEECWFKEKKPHGFDIQDARLGGVIKRLESCRERLESYLKGEIDRIDELEEKLLEYPSKEYRLNNYAKLISANVL